jgi:hypothetical protein
MKTELPAREEYYRLTRARELRAKAARLHHWLAAGTVCFLLAAGALFLTFGMSPVGILVCLLFLSAVAARPWAYLEGKAARLRGEAADLEAEHQSRYGALPAGESEECLSPPLTGR